VDQVARASGKFRLHSAPPGNRGVVMNRRVGLAAVVAVALLGVLLMIPPAASAQAFGCTGNAGCPAGTTCQLSWSFLGITYRACKAPPLCNADSECAGGTLCLNGTCQVGCRNDGDCPVGRCENSKCTTPPPPPGGGGSIPGEGRHCMPADGSRPPGWATDAHGKPLGACPAGTACNSHGFCMRPLQ